MLIVPAIDLRAGRVVRLMRGDYAAETVYSGDPGTVATDFVRRGARCLHVVDLDGARSGQSQNLVALRSIAASARAALTSALATMPTLADAGIAGPECIIQFGGGLRDNDAVAAALAAGANRLVLGSAALADPDWVASVAQRHPGRVVCALDARDGKVATEGWLTDTGAEVLAVARSLLDRGIGEFLFTDIGRDGTRQGPSAAALATIAALKALGAKVTASGGVGSLADLRRLADAGADAAIVGRALYEGQFTLEEAMASAV